MSDGCRQGGVLIVSPPIVLITSLALVVHPLETCLLLLNHMAVAGNEDTSSRHTSKASRLIFYSGSDVVVLSYHWNVLPH
ncbi:hypothetical protein BJV74DRAFT_833890 [Russula compacta]|nr:hypothetical protein BJV74DRAFT_833890 [Russula compacta]